MKSIMLEIRSAILVAIVSLIAAAAGTIATAELRETFVRAAKSAPPPALALDKGW
jgi:hypothetical protein